MRADPKLSHEVQFLLQEPLLSRHYPQLGAKLVRAVFTAIKEALLRGETVYVKGFGTFKIVDRKPHPTPNNILTNHHRAPIYANELRRHRPRKYVIFKPAVPLLAMLNLPSDGYEPNYTERRSQKRWRLS